MASPVLSPDGTPHEAINHKSLSRLPAPLVELVLQQLSLSEQLNECTHLCQRFPPLTATTVRYATLLLSEDAARQLRHSPRLLALLSTVTSVVLQCDIAPDVSRAMQFVLTSSGVDSLFPYLSSFGFVLRHKAEAMTRFDGNELLEPLRRQPFMAALALFLSARSITLHSFRIHSPTLRSLDSELDNLLAPLTSLRRLYIAGQLSIDNISALLTLPLDVLDLSDSKLSCMSFQRPSTTVLGSALLNSCRILRLPQLDHLTNAGPWQVYLDSIATQRTDSARPHTLLVQHMMTAAAVRQLIDSPPSRCMTLTVSADSGQSQVTSPQWLASKQLPHQLGLSISCFYWCDQRKLQPFFDVVTSYHGHIRSIDLSYLPRLKQTTVDVIETIGHCNQLETLNLSAVSINGGLQYHWSDSPAPQAHWPERACLARLHTLTLVNLVGAEQEICRLLSVCPSLQRCTLDLPNANISMLRVLALSCPLLSRLQLKLSNESIHATISHAGEEQSPSIFSFRSLVRVDLCSPERSKLQRWPQHMSVFIRRLALLLAGSPLKHVTLTLSKPAETEYHQALIALITTLPRLLRLQVTTGRWPRLDAMEATATWDDDVEGEADEKRAIATPLSAAHMASVASVSPLNESSTSQLHSLTLIVDPDSFQHFASLLSRTPAVTSIQLSLRVENSSLLLLYCLAHIGRHCPLIQHITFAIDVPNAHSPPPPPLADDEVKDVVDAYQLPERAFGCLRSVSQVGEAVELLSQEAAGYVKRQWMSTVQQTVELEWHPATAAGAARRRWKPVNARSPQNFLPFPSL